MSTGPLSHGAAVRVAGWPASRLAGRLLAALGAQVSLGDELGMGDTVLAAARSDEATDWTASGCMHLTGRNEGPALHSTGRPATLARAATLGLELLTVGTDRPVRVDGRGLLGERAALLGLRRNGDTSAGGRTRLLQSADAWVALSLARETDLELLPALLERPVRGDPWSAVAHWAAARPAGDLVDRAAMLGLAVGRFSTPAPCSPWALTRVAGPTSATSRPQRPLVVNLGALWAAPLAAHLLALNGARVIDVETPTRPDSSRAATPTFYRLLHEGHERLTVDFESAGLRARLKDLLREADVVLEASRPRALQALGLTAEAVPSTNGRRVWLRITGHGPDQPHRIAFGDDAAIAGGLGAWDSAGPVFAGDAIADPLTGMVTALLALACLSSGHSWIADVSLRDVAGYAAWLGPTAGDVTPLAPWVPHRVVSQQVR